MAPEDAAAEARLGVAVTHGLVLDLLATGDRSAVDAAMERYIAKVESLVAPHSDKADSGGTFGEQRGRGGGR